MSLASILYTRLAPVGLLLWNSRALPWHLEYVFQAMFYMVLGYIFKCEYEKRLEPYINKKTSVVVWLIYLLLVFMPYVAKITVPMLIDIIFDYIVSIVGIAAVVMTAKIVPSNRYVNYVGQNTLIYFALHGKAYSLIQTVLKKIVGGLYAAILGNIVLSSLFALLFALLLSVVLIIPAFIINKYFPFVVGRKSKDDYTRRNS